MLATLGEFHDRIRDLESKLGDRESRPVAASYDQLLSAKEAELTDLRKLGPERDRLTGQLAVTTNELHQARQRIAALEQQSASREKDLAALQTHTTVVADLEVARRRIAELETHVTRQDTDLRATRTGTAERDSLAAQLQTATTTIGSLKARITALDQQLREREQAFEAVRSRLLERDKLVPQYNAMIAEVYQARHRIAALEQRVSEKTRDLLPRQKGAQERPASGGQLTTAQRDGGTTTPRLPSVERSPATNSSGAESPRVSPVGQETVLSQSAPHTREPRALSGARPSFFIYLQPLEYLELRNARFLSFLPTGRQARVVGNLIFGFKSTSRSPGQACLPVGRPEDDKNRAFRNSK